MNTTQIEGIEHIPKTQSEKTKQIAVLDYCIIRTYSAGVWAGYTKTSSNNLCREVFNARRLWRWWSDFTLSELAVKGQKKGKEDKNKYAIPVEKVFLTQVIEIIPCTEKAMKQIKKTPNYKQD